MKNYTKKTGVILTSLIILCSLLFISCPNLFVPGSSAGGSSPSGLGSAPSGTGMGTLSLSVTIDSRSRTILPDFSSTTLNTYRLFFTGKPGVSSDQEIDINSYSALSSFEVPAGVYTSLRVYAYTNTANRGASGSVGKYAAWGTLTKEIDLSGSQTISDSITLSPAEPVAGGKGTFIYDITFPNGLTNVKMELTRVGGSTTTKHFVISSAPQVDADDGKMELDPGQYRLRFTLERPNTQTVIWREVLHVYQNMESKYEYEFEEDHFRKLSYTVTFDFNDSVREPLEISYFYDSFTSESGKNPADPTRDGHVFDGWHKNAAGTDPWVFGSNLTGPLTLYAKWIPRFPGGSVTITPVEGEGNYEVGKELRATFTPDPLVSGVTIQYEWNRNGVPIPGAVSTTSNLYTLVRDDAGARLTVTVRYVGYEGSVTSGETPVIQGARGSSWDNPFIVSDMASLLAVGRGEANAEAAFKSWTRDSYYVLVNPISLFFDTMWIPIGTESEPFIGGFDGGGYNTGTRAYLNGGLEIRNMTINNNNANQGMFGVVGAGAEIRNVVLINANITGGNNTGGIAGINKGEIKNSSVTFSVNSSNVVTGSTSIHGINQVGGIAGKNEGTISSSYFTGSVNGLLSVGGIAGENSPVAASAAIVENSYSTNSVYSAENAGGIVGLNSGTVKFCYSISRVSGVDYVGGIVGRNNNTVENCISLASNITAGSAAAGTVHTGRVVGNAGGNVSSIVSRGDMNDRIISGSRVQGHNGTSPASGVSLATLFSGWQGWNISGTLNVGNTLPTLTARTQNPAPTLQQIVTWGAPVTSNIDLDSNSLIRFNTSEGEQGWWAKRVFGEWLEGQMVENEVSVPRPINVTGVSNRNVNQLNNAGIGVRQSFHIPNNIGTMYITHTRESGNMNDFHFEIVLFTPFEEAYIYIGHNRTPNYNPSTGIVSNYDWIISSTDGKTIQGTITNAQNGRTLNFFFDVKSKGDWTFITVQQGATRAYPVFSGENGAYYWVDNNRGHWSFGPMNFYQVDWVGKPTLPDPNDGNKLKQHVIVQTYQGDPEGYYWIPDTVDGPDIRNQDIKYNEPLYGGSTTRPIFVTNPVLGNVQVGTAVITLLDGTTGAMDGPPPHGTGYDITNSEIKVDYYLDPDFAQYVESFTCHGVEVTGNTRTFTYTGSEITLDTVFTFLP